uniref:Uncharacterized protein n=1 Tax=Glossina pallidipes TaxID=7398 RepID=A0A1A9ZY05_GLOPL
MATILCQSPNVRNLQAYNMRFIASTTLSTFQTNACLLLNVAQFVQLEW